MTNNNLKAVIVVLFAFFFLFSLSFSGFGQNHSTMNLLVYNQNTLKPLFPMNVSGYQANINLMNLGNKTQNISLVMPINHQKELTINLTHGNWKILLSIINISSTRTEYFASSSIILQSNKNQSIYVMPVGSVRGVVVDSYGSVLRNVKIKFDCNNYQAIPIVETDSFGTFESGFIPEGNCYVYAVYNDFEWRSRINITRGETTRLKIIMNTGFTINDLLYSLPKIIFIAIILVLIILSYIFIRKIKSKKLSLKQQNNGMKNLEKITESSIKRNEEEKGSAKITRRFEIINPDNTNINVIYSSDEEKMPEKLKIVYDTLKEKEKEIILFLLKNNNSASSSKIGIKLSIPRTSLHRTLKSLEEKKIIVLDKESKPIKVRMSEFFAK